MKAVVLNGKVLHIGDWTHQPPPPDGAIAGDFPIVRTAAGQYVLASDYRTLRAAEYPTLGDQLDAMFHAGLFPADMAARLAAVKAKYPKQ